MRPNRHVFILTGAQGEGKTTRLKELIGKLRSSGLSLYGFYANGYWENGQRSRFDLVDVQTGKQKLLCTNQSVLGFWRQGRFYFDPETIRWGTTLLDGDKEGLAIMDEVGRFELDGKVWASPLMQLVQNDKPVLMVVRQVFVQEVVDKFGIVNPQIISPDDDLQEVAQGMLHYLKGLNRRNSVGD